ncbi:MAG: hypothetical protein LBI19_02700 [Oscillospiraceae bacterium]|jgi:hypothetical protein|nr:hypothetical protein [Oscillospiraceae bacterium]
MKRTTCVALAVLLVLLAASCSTGANNLPEHHYAGAKTLAFETVEEMEDFSKLIVKGSRQSGEETFVTTYNGMMLSGYVLSPFLITEVYKDVSGSLKEGDIITILENEVYDKATNIVYHIGGYKKMVEGCDYLLFLDAANMNGLDYYVAAGVQFGTVSLQEDGRADPVRYRRGEDVYIEIEYDSYFPLWEAAKEKYAP